MNTKKYLKYSFLPLVLMLGGLAFTACTDDIEGGKPVDEGAYDAVKRVDGMLLDVTSNKNESVIELRSDKYQTEVLIMTGFLDGINESLKGYENPIETMDEDTKVKIEIDPEKLYYNMVEAKATWLYELPQWDAILTEERRTELYREQKASGTVRNTHKIYPNDPCPCGSGKKYKQCCGRKLYAKN